MILAAGAALTTKPALEARARLEEARGLMETGRAALVAGEVEGARPAFEAAEAKFASALEQLDNPMLRIVSFLPILGRTVDTVDAVSEAGGLVAKAARITTSALDRLSGRPGGLTSGKGGGVPIEPLLRMAPPMERARVLVEEASAIVDGSEAGLLFGPVGEARAEFVDELEQAEQVLRAASALTTELPEFLGQEGPRRYFFGAQNPAELRGTGGLIGAYSILTVTEGRLDFGPFEPIQTLKNRLPGKVPAPNPSFSKRYNRFGGNGFWLNINMTPDFPSAATAIERLYADVKGEELDGTVVADPFALRALLAATGPVAVEGTDVTLTPDNVVQVLAHDAYAEFTDSVERKAVLGDSAKLVFQRFLEVTAAADPPGAARTLIQVAADGHVLLHAADTEIQRAFELTGAAGELRNPRGDYLGVYSTNAAANKADYYLRPSIRYRVRLNEDGSGEAIAIVHLKNGAPAEGESPIIIGPYDERFKAGENRTYLSTYCAADCRLESFDAEGNNDVIGSQEELGHPVFSMFLNTDSRSSSNVTYRWTVPEAWGNNAGENSYTLMYQGQNTIRPTILSLAIHAPTGTQIASVSPPLRLEGDLATWRGEPGQLMRFTLTLERPKQEQSWLIYAIPAALGLIVFAGLFFVRRRRAASVGTSGSSPAATSPPSDPPSPARPSQS